MDHTSALRTETSSRPPGVTLTAFCCRPKSFFIASDGGEVVEYNGGWIKLYDPDSDPGQAEGEAVSSRGLPSFIEFSENKS